MTVVVRSLWMHIKLKKVSSCYKEYKVQNIPISVLQLSLYQSMIEDSRAIYYRIPTYRACLFYLSCILIVIVLGFVFIYLAHTAVNSVNMYFVGLSDQDGRAGLSGFFLVSLISSAFGGRGLCSWSIF